MNSIHRLSTYYHHYSGWRTNQKLVVIESDDWGSIRTPSASSLTILRKKGGNAHQNPYNRLDTLESTEDFDALFALLKAITQQTCVQPIVTTNTILANPDFESIEKSGFTKYGYENFTETYKRYPRCEGTFKSFQQGIQEGYLAPQFHGREHLNVPLWLAALQNRDPELTAAFEQRCFGIDLTNGIAEKSNLMAAWNYIDEKSSTFVDTAIRNGLELFEQTFGMKSLSAIAPTGLWDQHHELVLKENGVRFLQGFVAQELPYPKGYKKIFHKFGERNSLGQYYLPRNCYFEPSTNQAFNWVGNCLRQVKTAFFFKKPAVISMHRINFVGGISADNRKTSLEKFERLLMNIIKKWSDVNFISSSQLGEIVENSN